MKKIRGEKTSEDSPLSSEDLKLGPLNKEQERYTVASPSLVFTEDRLEYRAWTSFS
jgi:hypothetical protein